MLTAWARSLRSGGWIALTEIDDLLGHEPLSVRTKELFRSYAEVVFAAGYDLHMGRKLRAHVAQAGFTVLKVLTPQDQELSFPGPADPEVLESWRSRFNRMKLLRDLCGQDFDRVQEEFLGCLMRADHESVAKVYCCIAVTGRAQA